MPRPRPGFSGARPADYLGGSIDRVRPAAVSGRVSGDERIAALGEVSQPQLQRVDAEQSRGLVDVRLDRPDLLRIAEATERGGGDRVGEDAAADDPHGRDPVRPSRGVRALGDRSVGDVRERADQVVGVDRAEGEAAILLEPAPDTDA